MAIIPQKISGNDHKKDFFNDLTFWKNCQNNNNRNIALNKKNLMKPTL